MNPLPALAFLYPLGRGHLEVLAGTISLLHLLFSHLFTSLPMSSVSILPTSEKSSPNSPKYSLSCLTHIFGLASVADAKLSNSNHARAQEQRMNALGRNLEYMQSELKLFKSHASRRDSSNDRSFNRDYSRNRDASNSNYGNSNGDYSQNRDSFNSNYNNRNQSPGRASNRDNSPNKEHPWCYYHRQYKHHAMKCVRPCRFNADMSQEKRNSENH